MTPAVTTLVARDAAESERVAAWLRARGEPAIGVEVLVWAAIAEVPDLPAVADLLVTSPRGADTLVGRRQPGWRVLALSGPTADRLRTLGIPPDLEGQGGAKALAALTRPGPVIHLTSDLGGAESAKARPDRLLWVGYQALCPAALPARLVEVLRHERYALWFGSPSAAQNFETLAPGATARAETIWAHGRTTLAFVDARGFKGQLRGFPEG